MRTKVQRWGNSLAVRIPKVFAEEMGLVVDSAVDLRVCDGKLVARACLAPAPTLADLLAGVTPGNLHAETDAGQAAGSEVW